MPVAKEDDPHNIPYTTNRLRQNAERVIAIIRGSKVVVRSSFVGQMEERKEQGALSEDFFRENLRIVDRYAARAVQPANTLGMLTYSAVVRGWVSALHMYARVEMEEPDAAGKMRKVLRSRPIFRFWDPYNIYWSVGVDGELDWICHTNLYTHVAIEEMYPGINLSGVPTTNDKDKAYPVYEFYDREKQYLIADGRHLKPPVKHGARNRVPASIIPVGSAPLVNVNSTSYPIEGLGQSVFDMMRAAEVHHNTYVNIGRRLMLASLKRSWILESLTGNRDIEEMGDPNEPGAITQTLKDEETLQPLPPVTSTIDFDKALQVNLSDFSNSMLPPQVFGNIGQRALSGYAINQITETSKYIVEQFREAVEAVYTEAEDCMRQMYTATTTSGAAVHDTAIVKGREIEPSAMLAMPSPEVRLKLQLPGDELAKVTIAQQLTQGDLPLMSIEEAQDDQLDVDDPDRTRRSLELQRMRSGNPLILILESIKAAEKIGDEQAVEVWKKQFEIESRKQDLLLTQLELEVAATAAGAQPPGGAQGPETAVPGQTGQPNGRASTIDGGRTAAGFTEASRGRPPTPPDERQTLGGRPPGSGGREGGI